MKYCYAISLEHTKFQSVAIGDWKENITLISELGYDGVELAIKAPELIDIDELRSLLEKKGLEVAAIGTGQAYVDEGLSLTHDDELIRSKTILRLTRHIDLASLFGKKSVIGLIRGRLGNNLNRRETRFNYFKNSIIEIANYASEKSVSLIIEPLNRYECDYLNTAEKTINIIREVNSPSLGILLDTFHMNIEEDDICEAFRISRGFLKHVHIADSNRKGPGHGHLDFNRIINVLKEINYKGYISGEILPYPNLEKAMQNFIEFFRRL